MEGEFLHLSRCLYPELPSSQDKERKKMPLWISMPKKAIWESLAGKVEGP